MEFLEPISDLPVELGILPEPLLETLRIRARPRVRTRNPEPRRVSPDLLPFYSYYLDRQWDDDNPLTDDEEREEIVAKLEPLSSVGRRFAGVRKS